MLCSAWDNLFQLCSCLNLQMGFDSQTLRGVTVRNLQLFKTKINNSSRAVSTCTTPTVGGENWR